MWSKSKPNVPVEFQYGGHLGEFHGMSSQSHLPHCRVANSMSWSQGCVSHCRVLPLDSRASTLQGAVTWQNQCHYRATLQGVIISSAILKIVFCHILFCIFFKCNSGFNERQLSYRLRYTCSLSPVKVHIWQQNMCTWWMQVIDGIRPMSRTESNCERSSSKGRSSRSRPQSMDSSAYEKLLAGIGSVRCVQGDHLYGKPGNVRDFDSCQRFY